MRLEFAALQENIEACEAQIAASTDVLKSMAQCLDDWQATSGGEIQPIHPTSADTPKGLIKVATDGERADGRLAWVPGL